MTSLTGLYATRDEAEAARERLIAAGMDAGSVTVHEPVDKPGVFDHLAQVLAPKQAGPGLDGRNGYRLVAEIPPERTQQARLILGRAAAGASSGSLSEQLFEFPETREELRIGKQPVVREEIVMRKEVREHVADVKATLRHTEVEVEEVPAAEPPAPEPLIFGGPPRRK